MDSAFAIVIVPDGLQADLKGATLPQPSFAFKQVLDYVSKKAHVNATVYIAPANHFGGTEPEHSVGASYLTRKRPDLKIEVPKKIYPKYVDTFGNAYYLRVEFPEIIQTSITLVSTKPHLARAIYCFHHQGYSIFESIGIPISTKNREPIVRRLFYYQFPWMHRGYEFFALVREIILTTLSFKNRKLFLKEKKD